MSSPTTYADFVRISKTLKDVRANEAVCTVQASSYFIRQAEKYGVTVQVLFEALIESAKPCPICRKQHKRGEACL